MDRVAKLDYEAEKLFSQLELFVNAKPTQKSSEPHQAKEQWHHIQDRQKALTQLLRSMEDQVDVTPLFSHFLISHSDSVCMYLCVCVCRYVH